MLFKKTTVFFYRFKLRGSKVAKIDPAIKLVPIIKPTGNLIVSFTIKLTLLLYELFWIPTIKIANKDKLKMLEKIIFLKDSKILRNDLFDFNTNYKSCFFLDFSF